MQAKKREKGGNLLIYLSVMPQEALLSAGGPTAQAEPAVPACHRGSHGSAEPFPKRAPASPRTPAVFSPQAGMSRLRNQDTASSEEGRSPVRGGASASSSR